MEIIEGREEGIILPEGNFKFWRYLFLIMIVIGVTLVAQSILIIIAALFEGNMDVLNFPPFTLLWVTMLPFAALVIVLIIGIRLIHQQTIKSIFTQKENIHWSLMVKSAIIWFVLSAVVDIIIALLQPGNYSFTFSLNSFIPFMLLAIILITFQITAEEVLFRSYLLHGFFRLFRFSWLAIIAQALLFGILHGANPEVTTYGLFTTMPFYIGIGLLLGWLSFKSRGLEIAMGVHFANNLYATAIVTFSGSAITSPAIFTILDYQPVTGLIAFVIMAIIFGLIITRIK
ncbi:MAG: type II CAAX endopeptidase family protein [Anaerolineaceae bacterium]|nr:type II CAAX endopeptidase family protein [Anaerolineaceae bacterium]